MSRVDRQAFSFSRLSLYATCPYKWFKVYMDKHSEPQRTYFAVGTVCHEVAELSAKYCTKQTWINKAVAYYYTDSSFKSLNTKDISAAEFCENIFRNRKQLSGTEFKNFGNLSWCIDSEIPSDEYEIVSMPPRDIYNGFFDASVANEKVVNPEIIEEARILTNMFYRWYDFSMLPNTMMLAEKKLAFDKDWKKVGFFSDEAYFRGVIDNTVYGGDKNVVITDYKTSRSMISQDQLSEDLQLKSYVKMIVKSLGRANVDSVTVRIVYMRFKTIIEHTFKDIDKVVDSITTWMDTLIQQIYDKGDDISNYPQTRNEYCHMCHIREDGNCPIFTMVKSPEGRTSDTLNEESCAAMWKESEILKDKYQSYQKLCKSFINTTDGVVMIDEKAVLDKHITKKKKFDPVAVVELALENKLRMIDILPYLSISEKSVNKMIKDNSIDVEEEAYSSLYELKNSSSFDAIVKKEE